MPRNASAPSSFCRRRRRRRRRQILCESLRRLKSTARYFARSRISRPFCKRARPCDALLDMGCMCAALCFFSFVFSLACLHVWLVISRLCQRKLVWGVSREVGTLRRAPQVQLHPTPLPLSTPLLSSAPLSQRRSCRLHPSLNAAPVTRHMLLEHQLLPFAP